MANSSVEDKSAAVLLAPVLSVVIASVILFTTKEGTRMALSSKIVDVKGRSVNILEGGSGQALVFLHGGGYVEGVDFLDALTDRFHVTVPLLPGYGSTELEPLLEGRQQVSAHLADVLDALGIDRAVIVGHSLGGWRAVSFASSYPERVVRLVLGSPAGMDVEGHPMTNMLAHTPVERRLILTSHSEVWKDRIPSGPDEEFAAARAKEMRSMAAFSPGLQDSDLVQIASHVSIPTLVLWGEADRLIPVAHVEAWKAAMPHASVHTFAGAGHLLFHERPDAVEAIATDNISETE